MKKNISSYKNRFYTLLESSLGDVKPINELFDDAQFDRYNQLNQNSLPASQPISQPTDWNSAIIKFPCLATAKDKTVYDNGGYKYVNYEMNGKTVSVFLQDGHIYDGDWTNTYLNKAGTTGGISCEAPTSDGVVSNANVESDYGTYQGQDKKYTVNPNVSAFQKAMTIIGYSTGKVDGKFGPKTKAGLESFQNDYELKSSLGKMDKATALKMIEVLKNEKPNESAEVRQELSKITGTVTT